MLHSRMLRYLDAVARCGSIRKAASQLNVASSAINRQILALEDELGTPVFERLHRRLRLTASGELLIAHVRQTLKEHERVRGLMEDLKGLRRGEVKIAAMGGIGPAVLPPILAAFRRRHPGVKILVRILAVSELAAAVAAGEVDLGFALDLPRHPGVQNFAAIECRIGAVVAPGHDLAARSTATLSDCVVYPVILPDPGVTLRRLLDDAFVRTAIAVVPAVETNSIELMLRLARQGVGVTFLNQLNVAEERQRGEIAFVPLRDRHLKSQLLGVVGRAKAGLDALPSLMVEELRTAFGAMTGHEA
ncbi:MAG TPA: LysR family transcriptional regulator [Stellaceae bacterium]|nr:LysR family transcriptional regulator [Stellaceae bacterium]